MSDKKIMRVLVFIFLIILGSSVFGQEVPMSGAQEVTYAKNDWWNLGGDSIMTRDGLTIYINSNAPAKCYTHDFTLADWVFNGSDSVITIPESVHGLGTGYKLVQQFDLNNRRLGRTYNCDPVTGDIELTVRPPQPTYEGAAYICGD